MIERQESSPRRHESTKKSKTNTRFIWTNNQFKFNTLLVIKQVLINC